MTFRLVGLEAEPFQPLFALADDELARRAIRRVVADEPFGYPCRVSLEDARPGDELLLLSFEHQGAASPYRASGPIFVRRGVSRATLEPGVVPESVARRLISLRAYDAAHDIVEAEVCEGTAVADRLAHLFAAAAVRYVQLHNARRGCFSCTALRADAGR